jgi:hypothetical protein
MAQRADERCSHCQRVRPYDVMVPGEMLRPAIIDSTSNSSPSRRTFQLIRNV